MLSLYSLGRSQFFDANGDPLSGGLLYTYSPGTTTPKTAYTDKDGATPHSNPIVLDTRGETAIWLDGKYKFVLKNTDGTTVWTEDNQFGIGYAVQTGALTKGVGGSANVALTSIEAGNHYIEFTGVLTGNISVTVPDGLTGYSWTLKNSTTGSYTLTFKTVSGTGVAITQGLVYGVYCDASNVAKLAYTGIDSNNLATTRRADVVAGGIWVDSDYDTNKWAVYQFDGANDILQFVVNISTNLAFPSNGLDYASVTPDSDADVTLSAIQYQSNRLVLENGSWTTGRNIIVPNERRAYFIDNSSGTNAATIKTAAGTGIAVAAATSRVVACDGVNVVDPLSAFAIASSVVSSFNSRTGAVTLTSADVSNTDGSATAGTNYAIVIDSVFNNPPVTKSGTYAETINLRVLRAGTFRVATYLSSGAAAVSVYARVYKNGVAVGTEHTVSTTSGSAFTDDITFASGDTLQVFMKTGNTSYNSILNYLMLGVTDSPRLTMATLINIGQR